MDLAPASIAINAQAHPINSVKWNGDRLVFVSQAMIALIRVASAGKVDRPHEIAADFAKIGEPLFTCETEDAYCIPERSPSRLVDAVYSPHGLGKHRGRLLAMLTADRRCAVYAPLKHPDKDRWDLRHSLLKNGWKRLGYDLSESITEVEAIKHLRTTSIAWTPPYFHGQDEWGASFLITGNEAGDVHFHRINWDSEDLHFSIKCSQKSITTIQIGTLSCGGQLRVFLSDSEGALYIVLCQTFVQEGILHIDPATSCTQLSIDGRGLISNMAVLEQDDQYSLLAVSRSGIVTVYEVREQEIAFQTRHTLSYYGPVAGLCWAKTFGKENLLFVFGSTGNVLCLEYSTREHRLEPNVPITEHLRLLSDQLLQKAIENFNDLSCKYTLCYNGIALSPENMLLGVSYTVKPIDRIQYLIPSSHRSHFAIMSITNNAARDLQLSLAKFLQNPHAVSLSTVASLHKRLDVSLLSSLDSLLQERIIESVSGPLQSPFQGGHIINNHRVALCSKELEPAIASQINTALKVEYLSFVLGIGSSGALQIGVQAAQTLHRLATYALSYLESHTELIELATMILRKLDVQKLEDGPDRSAVMVLCPACHEAIRLDETMTTAHCNNNHVWPCCSLTLQLLSGTDARTCLECGRKAILPGPDVVEAGFYAHLLELCDLCFYCTGEWYTRF